MQTLLFKALSGKFCMGTFVQCPVEYVEDGFVQLINSQNRSRQSMIYEVYRITIPGQQLSHLQRSKNHLLPVNWCLCSLIFFKRVEGELSNFWNIRLQPSQMSRVFLRVSHPLPEIFFSSCSNSGSSHEFRAAFNMFQPSFGWISHGETTQWPHGARVTIPDPVKRTDQRTDQDPVEVSRLESAWLFDWMHEVYICRYVYMMYVYMKNIHLNM